MTRESGIRRSFYSICHKFIPVAEGLTVGRLFVGSLAVAGLAAVAVSPAVAQDSETTTVGGRERPNYDALGVPLSSFLLYPSLTLGTEYNDNIYSEEHNRTGDVIFTVTPQVSLQSDWNNHALGIEASATIFRYADKTEEDVEDYSVAANGRYDVLRNTAINSGLGFSQEHEDRGSPDDVDGREPTVYHVVGGQLGLSHRFNRVWTDVVQDTRYLNYNDTPAQGGGNINNDDRDRMEFNTRLRVGYDFHPDASAFLQTGFNAERYDQRRDDQGFKRDSYSYSVDVGTSFDLTGVIFGEVFAGVQQQFYEDSEFGNSRVRPSFGAGIDWNATRLTTVTFDSSSSFEETTVSDASSVWAWDNSVGVNHELLRNVILDSGFGYRREDYLNTSRVDNVIDFSFGATYMMNRYIHLSADYTFQDRSSDADGQDYTENIVGINVRFQY
ncbi:MAG TPA: outer membrane beta-barrel protein [Afifellaceae bacterium]|nr:outer membrane beta-barrel protein [Afifellaceae bacterium]